MRAIITGASSGIGSAIAIRAAELGWQLVLTGRNEERLNKVTEQCRENGAASVESCLLDLGQMKDFSELVRAAERSPEQGLILINNAGTGRFGPVLGSDLAGQLVQIESNLFGTIALTHALLPELVRRKGQILNILSIAATSVLPGSAAYAASKAGLLQFMKVLREETRKDGMRIINLSPGATDTAVWDGGTWKPDPADMLEPETVADVAIQCLLLPRSASTDEVTLLPAKGIL